MCTSMPWWMPWSCRVRIISRPVRSPTWARRGIAVAAEVALQDAAVVRAVEERAPGLQLAHAVGRLLGVQLGHAPVVEVLAAAHRVGEVDLPAVALVDVGQRRGDAALGHHGVRLAEQRLADQADLDARPPTPRWRRAGRRRRRR